MTQYDDWLETALVAAREAGACIRDAWRTAHMIESKGFRDILTETDTQAEAIILRRLRATYPDHAITSEEAGAGAGAQDAQATVRWLIDPVDGTTNFSRDNPNFSTSIAAVENGVPVAGVVYEPLRDLAFTAYAGGGAALNGEPIHVSGVTEIDESIFGIDTPRDPVERRRMLAYVGRYLEHGRTLRALGSAALNIAYVAAGWVDGYFSVHMKPWDQAAGALIIREAGGVAGTISGQPWTPYQPDPLMASSRALLAAAQSVLTDREPSGL